MTVATLASGIAVPASPEQVWERLVTWERQGEWIVATAVRATTERRSGLGTGIVARTGAGPVALADPMVVTVWEPPRRCEMVHLGPVLRGDGGFWLQPLHDDPSRPLTRLTWWERIQLPSGALLGRLSRVGWLAARPVVTLGLDRSLRRFARQLARQFGEAAA